MLKLLREKFYESIEKDNDKWKMSYHGSNSYSWIEYNSPKYNRISYNYSKLTSSVTIYIDGVAEDIFMIINPIKIIKVRKLIKQINKRYKEEHINKINKIIKENFN